MAARVDMLQEVINNLNSSGEYEGEWYESAGVRSIFIPYEIPNGASISIQHSVYTFDIVSQESLTDDMNSYNLPSRYFRVVISGGSSNAAFRFSVRVSEFM